MEKPEYYPKILQAILLLLLFLFVFTLVPELFLVSLFQALGFKGNSLLTEIFSTIAGFFLLLFWVNRRYRIDYRGLFSLKQLELKYILPMIAIVIGLNIILSELNNILWTLIPLNADWLKALEAMARLEKSNPWGMILMTVLITPVVHEMVYRGVILRGFIKHYPPHRAIAVSTLLFVISYLNFWQFWSGIAWGVVSGWWFYKTRSLIPSLLGSIFFYSLSFIALLLGLNIPGYTGTYTTAVFQPWWFDLTGIGLLGLGSGILIGMFKTNWQS